MIPLGIAVLAAQAADLLTFMCAASVLPIAGEGNPAARWLFVNYGFLGVIAYKLIGFLVMLLALANIRDAWQFGMGIAIVAVTLLAAGTNTLAVVWSR